MTNFEKWKRDLTIENLAEMFYVAFNDGDPCAVCPIGEFECPAIRGWRCAHEISNWANEEAKENA